MRLMICGGAGYIGSHMCKLLAEHGHSVAVIDDFSTGFREAAQWGELHPGDVGDRDFVRGIFTRFKPEAVFHFAAKSQVGESGARPAEYYLNNVLKTSILLDEIRQLEGCPLIFSSTAAIFGEPVSEYINESHPRNPINAYGRTKLAVEFMLEDYWNAYRLPSVSFRYFNAAGADPSGLIGEAHNPETHLIPRLLESILDRGEPVQVFGNDYDTADGTCIRDYIHVNDLCMAHLLGLQHLLKTPGATAFNLGNGAGFSVAQVVSTAAQVSGKDIPHKIAPRRSGDAARLVADSTRAREALGWQPQFPALSSIIETAWKWHQQRRF